MNEKSPKKSVSQQIVETATVLFAVKGYDGVSVRELTETAGVNSALITYYFGGKKELYTHIISSQIEVLVALIDEMKAVKLLPKEKIYCFADKVIAAHKKYPYLIRLVMGEIINHTDCYESVVKKVIMQMNNFLGDCIQRGIDAGEFKAEVSPAAAGIALIGIINFYFLTSPLSQELLGEEVDVYIQKSLHHYLLGMSTSS